MDYTNWRVSGYDRSAAVEICHMGINPLVAVVLASRGITDINEIKMLTSESSICLDDPFGLKDMDRAVSRINRAIESREHIAIYGDYDVDGITSTCLLTEYFRDRGLECDAFIPERLEDGYGVKSGAITGLHEKGVTLIITVDCGITAIDETEFAKGLGIDIIITDHHECGSQLPEAVAVIDPKRTDDTYPFKSFAGVGVAFKLLCALESRESEQEKLCKYGDIIALGTIADVMPVTGENRVFIKYGLLSMKNGGRPGLKALCTAAGVDIKQLSVTNVGFALAPRLNAAGRVGSTDTAAKLLLTKDAKQAELLAEKLCDLNRKRQQLESELYNDALEMLEYDKPDDSPIVIESSKWHQGVAGIAASRLSEKFGLPVIVICLKDGVGRGSCRSWGDFNIFEALEACGDVLESFGGHDMAAGLTVREENISLLREKIGKYYRKTVSGGAQRILNIDFEVIKPGLLTEQNISALSALEPYGNGNPQPTMYFSGASVTSILPLSGGRHTKLWIQKNGENFECLFFSKTPGELGVHMGDKIDIAFVPQVSEYRGRKNIQLLLSDLRMSVKRK